MPDRTIKNIGNKSSCMCKTDSIVFITVLVVVWGVCVCVFCILTFWTGISPPVWYRLAYSLILSVCVNVADLHAVSVCVNPRGSIERPTSFIFMWPEDFISSVLEHHSLGVLKFSKNEGATLKFQAPEGWREVRSTPRTHKYLAAQYKIQSSGGLCTPAIVQCQYSTLNGLVVMTATCYVDNMAGGRGDSLTRKWPLCDDLFCPFELCQEMYKIKYLEMRISYCISRCSAAFPDWIILFENYAFCRSELSWMLSLSVCWGKRKGSFSVNSKCAVWRRSKNRTSYIFYSII